ncbi:IPTL-CTERM sorting domain-containing protein [Comamonas sp. JUb58]|uniref:IPTL-CTERM sorting domain-containing protein n=1 Tax=Comamonas sp. JUb58 TaxID=2485114 RepID=UPI00105CBF8E|nr:IPTL-CTERM sorting domain-containing protein [Comamonas sp. JUb58]TDS71087.1 putative secreted protein (IPTL-CTERM system target) [Comamonas sp. JUb58]
MKIFISWITKSLLVLTAALGLQAVQAQGLNFTPGSINFSNTVAGSVSAQETVTVQYEGPFPPILTVNSITPPANPAFAVVSSTCVAGPYPQFAPCTITFTFTPPTTAGPVSDTFSFASTELGTQSINLNGVSDGATPQAIAFTSTPPDPAPVGGSYDIAATGGGSGEPVVFSIDPSADAICSVTGNTVNFLSVGTCVVNANQAGNGAYFAAPQVQQSFAVTAGPTANPGTPTAVPTLSTWAAMLLSALLAGAMAVLQLRRKGRRPSGS